MKVIKKGSGAKGWSKRFKCTGNGNGGGGCGATLLVEHGDLMTTGSHHYDGSSDYYTSFYCSECGVMTDIENYDGPAPTKTGPGGRS